MKLKITDKKLTSLADKWVFDTNGHRWSNNNGECGDNFGSYCTGFRAAEQMHQAKFDTSMQIIEKCLAAFVRINYNNYRGIDQAIELRKIAADTIIETDKMMKELNQTGE